VYRSCFAPFMGWFGARRGAGGGEPGSQERRFAVTRSRQERREARRKRLEARGRVTSAAATTCCGELDRDLPPSGHGYSDLVLPPDMPPTVRSPHSAARLTGFEAKSPTTRHAKSRAFEVFVIICHQVRADVAGVRAARSLSQDPPTDRSEFKVRVRLAVKLANRQLHRKVRTPSF
jgi:hypothetical protein